MPRRLARWIQRCLRRFHELKTEHQYLGRYSVDKITAFDKYQQTASIYRVLAVVILSPLPTLLVLIIFDSIKLEDPRLNASHQTTTFIRSGLSHLVMTYMFLLAGKQALGLRASNSTYSHTRCLFVAACAAASNECVWVMAAFTWKFPVPMRELLGVGVWGTFVVIHNYLFAKKDLARVINKLKRYIPVVGTQMVLFYFLLGLSILFAVLPYEAQLFMIFAFPVLKVGLKRQLWKYARELDDISADVTICMVEISGSLYQTVCMQYVQSNLMALLIMGMDFLQAVIEARVYIHHEYIGDTQSTLQTAIKIIETSHANMKPDKKSEAETNAESRDFQAQSHEEQVDAMSVFLRSWGSSQDQRRYHRSPSSLWNGFLKCVECSWRKLYRTQLKRRQRYTIQPTTEAKFERSRPQSSDLIHNNIKDAWNRPRSVYIQAQLIRTRGSRRLLDFGRIVSPRTEKTVSTSRVPTSSKGGTRSRRNRSVELPTKSIIRALFRVRSLEAEQKDAKLSVQQFQPTPDLELSLQNAAKAKIREAIAETLDTDRPTRTIRRLTAAGITGIMIDQIFVRRRDQARILEQTSQLLFATEVLLFVEYMEVFMPLLYAGCIGTLWELPTAKYNILLNRMSRNQVVLEVATSLAYAALELVSFLSVYGFVKKRYGISALYQLAFLLETYWMTLQGKLIGCFITILNSATIHQGVDLTFKFSVSTQMSM